jgi:hypothetical protein
LRKGYRFAPAYGAAISKGKGKSGKRPVVVAPLEDRIVQRAILDTLQSSPDYVNVRKVLETPTSVGGLPGRGVRQGIELIDARIAQGDVYFAQSDIRGFFTKIPKLEVYRFLREDGVPEDFIRLFELALTVELENESSLSEEDRNLFPTGDDGVAQGCPLSALAGNIVLLDFDTKMNGKGITCVRYIDDFILIGRKKESVRKAFLAASEILKTLGMDVYDPGKSEKAFIGPVSKKPTFLGYQIVPDLYPPGESAQKRLLSTVDALISDGKKTIKKAAKGRSIASWERAYVQTLAAIDNTIKGWKGSFVLTRCESTMKRLDAAIDRKLLDFAHFHDSARLGLSPSAARRALGVTPLS